MLCITPQAVQEPHTRCLLPCCVPCCSGTDKGTRGTAYVVYEDIYDAKQALEHLGGFNVQNRYLILQVWRGLSSTAAMCSALQYSRVQRR